MRYSIVPKTLLRSIGSSHLDINVILVGKAHRVKVLKIRSSREAHGWRHDERPHTNGFPAVLERNIGNGLARLDVARGERVLRAVGRGHLRNGLR
ncbi:MAG: hypothetical protein ACXAAO_12200 [Candidatus Thorarchaeota archaeon]|jgi:hypothetical protein